MFGGRFGGLFRGGGIGISLCMVFGVCAVEKRIGFDLIGVGHDRVL